MTTMLLSMGCDPPEKKATPPTVNPEQAEQACIEHIIAMDDSLGKVRNHACETISLSQTIVDYVQGMNDLDFGSCPKEFTQAFTNHKNAWLRTLKVTDGYPDLRGEMHDLFDAIEAGPDSSDFKPLVKSIWDTWGEVEAAMAKK